MRMKGQFTRLDAATLLICVLLSFNLAVVGRPGRARAKQAVCLANLRQLTLAWSLYADDNDDKIVNGEADYGTPGVCSLPLAGRHAKERWWVGTDAHPWYMTGRTHPQDVQMAAIRAGALFPYVLDVRVYRCPNGVPGAIRAYSITDAMNGLRRDGTYSGDAGARVGQTVLWVKKMAEIVVPRPDGRAVFVDEGSPTPDSYAVHYVNPRWWDPPRVRHGGGTNVSFADGHSVHWAWEAAETVTVGSEPSPLHQYAPATPEGRRDLQKMQIAVWGRLGY